MELAALFLIQMTGSGSTEIRLKNRFRLETDYHDSWRERLRRSNRV